MAFKQADACQLPCNDVLNVLEQLKMNSSRLAKIEILKQMAHSELLKKVFDYTYNNSYIFGVKEITAPAEFRNNDRGDESPNIGVVQIILLLETLLSGKYRPNSNEMHQYITEFAAENLNETHFVLLQRILARDLLVGVTETTYKKAWGLDKSHSVSLCDVWNEKTSKKIKWPAYIQMKYDAARCEHLVLKTDANGAKPEIESYTRNLKPLKFSPSIQDELIMLTSTFSNNVRVDGEAIYKVDGVDRKKSNGFFNKMVRDTATPEERANFKFAIWDMYVDGDNRPYEERYSLLVDMFNRYNFKHLELAETQEIFSIEEAQEIATRNIKRGFEGAIVKNKGWVWCGKRTQEQLKLKAERRCELRVIGMEEGKNSRAGRLGAFICKSECGKLKVNVGGFTEKEQHDFYNDGMINSIISVVFNEVITDKKTGQHSLFLPRFDEVRLDKDVADTLEQIMVL